MRYWISCDGGGTKLLAILIDEDLRVVHSAQAGGINPNFLSMENIRKNAHQCMEDLLKGLPPDGVIEHCYLSMPGPAHVVVEALEMQLGIGEIPSTVLSEGLMGMLAGFCGDAGFVALAGTGSDVFYEDGKHAMAIGGWGMLLGDEGSGTHIGQAGLQAAIRYREGWGEETALLGELKEWLEDDDESRWMNTLVPKVYQNPSPRAVLASFAPRVSKAAGAGDVKAREIICDAGFVLAKQMISLIGRALAVNPNALALPSSVCGGAWKGSRLMFDSYKKAVHEIYPQLSIEWPLFEGVAGGIVLAGKMLGYSKEQIKQLMLSGSSQYRYPDMPLS